MSRLFISPREIDFISDLTKEMMKDIMGQKIYYYHVRPALTNIHDVYEEAPDKVFDPPIEIEAMVEWQPGEMRTNKFGSEEYVNITVFLHQRDLIDKEITILDGDFFSYGDLFFEITSNIVVSTVFGQVEHETGIKIEGRQSRIGQIFKNPIGPTLEHYNDADAVQDEFHQQRGYEENKLGKTGDKRQLQADGKLDAPLTGPSEVSPIGDESGTSSSFYDDQN